MVLDLYFLYPTDYSIIQSHKSKRTSKLFFSGVATPVSLKGACNTASSGSAYPSPVSSDGGGTFPQELIYNFSILCRLSAKLSINS